ncbi:MAG TPA: alpha-hydroxy-acid oxidizing protein [Xanthobacteraceae bacterium]|jgi:lactate oxidase|nr:alpha-hydroxy-acid oxidizing protein [Xanthobacteraceae bacterium]
MNASRRNLIQALAAGGAALATTQVPSRAFAESSAAQAEPAAPPPVDVGEASSQERALNIVSIEELEDGARKILSPGRFAVMGFCGDGWTYRENRRAFNDFPIMPRRLQGVKEIDLRTTLLGHDLALPVFTCPTGSQGTFHVKAELPNAGGTGASGTLFVASGASNRPMEEIAKATPGPKWFQIYMNRDMELNRWLVRRAKAAGFSAIVLTADALGPGQSDDFIRLGRPRAAGLTAGNHDLALGGHGNFADQKHDLSFSDITFLREASGLPVLVKGVVQPEDIRQSLAEGAAGIWISNHGGRQMDGGPASVSMLRTAVDTVEGRVPVVLDSGIRRGVDVFKALALGATAVGIGRPALWGLINGGSLGVKGVYAQLATELRATMLLSGVAKVTDLKRENLAKV